MGSPTGGTLLTIQGTGFTGVEGEIAVDIDGIPCEVGITNEDRPALENTYVHALQSLITQA